jgi:hypothetical protein
MQFTVLWESPCSTEMRSNLRFCTGPVPDPTFARLEESTDGASSEFIEGVADGWGKAGSVGLPQADASSTIVINKVKTKGDRFLSDRCKWPPALTPGPSPAVLFVTDKLGNQFRLALELRTVKSSIQPISCQQLGVGALLHQPATIHHQDQVSR